MKISLAITVFLALYILASWIFTYNNAFQDESRETYNSIHKSNGPSGEREKVEKRVHKRVKYSINFDKERRWAELEMHSNQSSPHHSIRKRAPCFVPDIQRNGSIACVVDTHKTICKQKCKFGHTLSDGFHNRTMTCYHWQNVWKPFEEFEACKPFVDCEVTLKPGGFYRCYHPSNKETVCQISCDHFENITAVPETSYVCNIHGVWTPKLPFCAKGGIGQSLAPAPPGIWVVRD